jgi:hypothetical protein
VLEDVEKLAILLAAQQDRMDTAAAGATEPAVAATLRKLADTFRTSAAAALADARARAARLDDALRAVREEPDAPDAAEAPASEPSRPADVLEVYLHADWFASFGHHVHPSDLD